MKTTIKYTSLICLFLLYSCKSYSPYFNRRELKGKGYYLKNGNNDLILNRIEENITNEKGIGLYSFIYPKGKGEIYIPVLRFEQEYYLYSEDTIQRKKISDAFKRKYFLTINDIQMKKIIETFNSGMTFVGHH